jgi:sec-independent protein translocase protein TatB
MIDIGVTKIVLISVVALIVLGPERLPKLARTAGNLFGRAQRYMSEVKEEVGRQMEQEELRKMKEAATEAFTSAKNDFKGFDQAVSSEVSRVSDDLNASTKSITDEDPIWSSGTSDSNPYPELGRIYKGNTRQGKTSWRNKKGAIPLWFKRASGFKTRVQSGSARVKRFRRATIHANPPKSFFG